MGIMEKLPLLKSNHLSVRFLGVLVYCFMVLVVLAIVLPLPHDHTATTNTTGATSSATSNAATVQSATHETMLTSYDVDNMLRWHVGQDKYVTNISGNNSRGYNVIIQIATADSVFTDYSFVHTRALLFVDMFRELFKDSRIQTVFIYQNLEFRDKYGNKVEAPAISVGMSKSTAQKIGNWDNFRDMVLVDYNKLFGIADTHYIKPTVEQGALQDR